MSGDTPDLIWIELHVEAFGGEADHYVSIARAKWDAMTDEEREAMIQELTDDHLSDHVSAGGVVVEADAVPASYRKEASR